MTGDDAEFYRARCSTTQQSPYNFDTPCRSTDYIAWTGPLPGDSATWAASRATTGRALFAKAGLSRPTIWETPHYFASAVDYAGIDTVYHTRYEREIFPSGLLGGSLDYTHIFGQFFPYMVHDAYGEKVIPENLGNYEPVEENNNPPRPSASSPRYWAMIFVHNRHIGAEAKGARTAMPKYDPCKAAERNGGRPMTEEQFDGLSQRGSPRVHRSAG